MPIRTRLSQTLAAAGLIQTPSSPEAPPAPCLAQARARQEKRAAVERALAPAWEDFLDSWLSPELHTAAGHSLPSAASAWAQALPPDFSSALEAFTGQPLQELLLPWVSLASARRHADIPAPADALLSGWIAALDPDEPEPPTAAVFWSRQEQAVRAQDSRRDRLLAETTAPVLAQALAQVLEDHAKRQPWGFGTVRHAFQGLAGAVVDLCADGPCVHEAGLAVARATVSWKTMVDPEQAYPALAIAVEAKLKQSLGTQTPAQIQALERWLANAFAAALPHALADRLYVPAVRSLVRAALQQETHPQDLVPPPLLRSQQ